MTLNAAVCFFLGLAAIALGGVSAATWGSAAKDGLALMTGAAALAQAIAAVVMIVGLRHAAAQAGAALAAVDVARASSERQLRAYVQLDRIEVSSSDFENGFSIQIVFANRGQTPAHHLRARSSVQFLANQPAWGRIEKEIYDRLELTVDDMSEMTLGVGATNSLSHHFDSAIGAKYAATLRSGTTRLILKTAIDYVDVFGEQRETNFVNFLGKLNPILWTNGPPGTSRST